MKLVTHNLFSTGLMVFVVSWFGHPDIDAFVLVVIATTFTNLLIDEVGHTRGDGVPRRQWVTHSVVSAPLWGGAAWALTLVLPAALLGVLPPDTLLFELVILGALAGWSHLLLDWLTEGGVFAFDESRRALAHFSYDNLPLNFGFCALGVALILVAIV